MSHVRIEYHCQGCMPTGVFAPLQVHLRREDEDVEQFATRARHATHLHHCFHSPQCKSKACDLKLPFGKDGVIGGPGVYEEPAHANA